MDTSFLGSHNFMDHNSWLVCEVALTPTYLRHTTNDSGEHKLESM